jgi:hypothetical protein
MHAFKSNMFIIIIHTHTHTHTITYDSSPIVNDFKYYDFAHKPQNRFHP